MLRWAILGTGFISNTVVEAIGQSDGSRVELVAGRNAERVAAFQADHSIPRSTSEYHAALTDPDVDVVYIGLPNHAHHELAIAAAQAGKAVLSEKSLTTTMETAHALVDGVRDRVFFVEGLMYLAHPLYSRVVQIIQSGELGTIRSISGRYAADIKAVVNPAGRGTIYNLGCYPASLLHLVMQTAFGDAAFAARSMWGAGNPTPDGTIGEAMLALRFDNGVIANLWSTDDYGMSHDFVVMGERAVLRFETNPWLPAAGLNVLTVTPYDGDPERVVVDDDHDAFFHQVELVERCVAAGLTEAPRPSPRLDDSLALMALLTEWEAGALANSASSPASV